MTEPSPLEHAELFHTGIVVDDLASAKEEFGDLFGITWFEGGAVVRMLTPDGSRIVRSAYALSAEGPHHIELTKSVEGTVWSVTGTGHAHHLGYWVDDVEAASAALTSLGVEHVATVSPNKEDAIGFCAYHQGRNGLYVEVVSRALRPVLLRSSS